MDIPRLTTGFASRIILQFALAVIIVLCLVLYFADRLYLFYFDNQMTDTLSLIHI